MEKSPTLVHLFQIDRKPLEIFTFDKSNGYHVSNRTMNAFLTGESTMGGVSYFQ